MKRNQTYLLKLTTGLVGLALAAMAWADITNVASVMFRDSSGTSYTRLSNTVVVLVSTTSLTPATPTLNLPPYLRINAIISAGYSGSDPAAYFQWSFVPVTSIPAQASARAVSPAPAASFRTQSATANLALQVLGLGPYQVTVTVFDANGQASAPAQAYVTLVSADLGSVRVYPNPWRSDKHGNRPITFDNLSLNSTIKIYTVAGHWVKSLPESSGSVTWDLTTDGGDDVASGLYVYLIKDDQGQKKTGQIAVIK